MSDKTKWIIADLRVIMADMTAEEREEVHDKIIVGYCVECWRVDPDGRCQCWNDE